MPLRSTFACLWCGRPHRVGSAADLEGWAQLCPDCLGRAGDNPFLRFRLHAALEERAAARRSAGEDGVEGSGSGPEARGDEAEARGPDVGPVLRGDHGRAGGAAGS